MQCGLVPCSRKLIDLDHCAFSIRNGSPIYKTSVFTTAGLGQQKVNLASVPGNTQSGGWTWGRVSSQGNVLLKGLCRFRAAHTNWRQWLWQSHCFEYWRSVRLDRYHRRPVTIFVVPRINSFGKYSSNSMFYAVLWCDEITLPLDPGTSLEHETWMRTSRN